MFFTIKKSSKKKSTRRKNGPQPFTFSFLFSWKNVKKSMKFFTIIKSLICLFKKAQDWKKFRKYLGTWTKPSTKYFSDFRNFIGVEIFALNVNTRPDSKTKPSVKVSPLFLEMLENDLKKRKHNWNHSNLPLKNTKNKISNKL